MEIKTGHKKWAGTDANIYIKIIKDGDFIALNNVGYDDFERGRYVNI